MGNILKVLLIFVYLCNCGFGNQQCSLSPIGSSDLFEVICEVKSINEVFHNISMVDSNLIGRLKVSCDNFTLLENVPLQINQMDADFDILANNTFGYMRNLNELYIENCKLTTIPTGAFNGVPQLQSLTYRSKNFRESSPNFELSPETFSRLQLLEHIDLSENNMINLPQTLLCPLRKLQSLNLTKNSFNDITNVGFSTGTRDNVLCYVDVKRVLLSHNGLRVLTNMCFAAVDQLKQLYLDHNYITKVEDTAFFGLKHLEILDISYNHICSLPTLALRPCEELAELYLQQNKIEVLSLSMFKGLKKLRILDVSHNQITTFLYDENVFDDIHFESLHLNYNRLSRLDITVFRNQHMLEKLFLDHNEIEVIPNDAFSAMRKLHILTLNNNKIKYLAAATFNGLVLLDTLSLNDNNIDNIHVDAFSYNISVTEISLSNNKLSAVPAAVQSLKNLRSLDISNNNISSIDNGSHRGLENLYSLILSGNKIGNLSRGVFEQLPSLRVLNLDHNEIVSIDKNTFLDIPFLHALRLDSNFLTEINGLFINLHDLMMLNVSSNRIEWFDYALIPIGLQWLDLHDNQIELLGNYYQLEEFLKLRTLDASFNHINEIDASSLPKGIEIVFLNDNHIEFIQPFTFVDKPNLMRVDLRRNNLQNLEVNDLRLEEFPARKPLPKFSISENPYLCDCNMEWIKIKNSPDRQHPSLVDIENVTCRLMFNRQGRPLLLKNTQSSQFLCPYKNHCFSLCHCCDFDACDCEMSCPDKCSCYFDKSWQKNIVDCSSAKHIVVPPRIPMDVSDLFLDGNDITSLYSHTFIGRKLMKVLYLNNSNVQFINNRTFNGLKSLQSLYLQNNLIANLSGFEFERLVNLRHLYLSYNKITSIGNTTFMHLKALEVLHLDNNFITHFQVWNLNQNDKLFDIQLSNNSWPCECNFIEDFSDWLQLRTELVHDKNNVKCIFNNTHSLSLVVYNITTCTNATALVYSQSLEITFLPLIIIISTVFLLSILIIVLMIVFRKKIKTYFPTRLDARIFDTERRMTNEEKLFDAFILYSRKESSIVEALAAELEQRDPIYRLCLYYRDLPMGVYLSEAILEAMRSSQRTILVLSMNFIRIEWFYREFQAVHHDFMQNIQEKLIVILVGRITEASLDDELKVWLQSSIFLHWGERRFWEKLKRVLPKGRRYDPHHSVTVHI